MRTLIARESATGKLYVVVTDLPGDDGPYRQFAFDVQGRRDALDPGFDAGNVDIDVFEPLTVPNTVELVFEGDEE